jgi:predicted DNA-binding transcriptional regulator AlpA
MLMMAINPSQRDGTSLLISIEIVAGLIGVSVRTVQRWVYDGLMPKPINPNGRPLWRRSEIVEWVALGCPRRTARPRHSRAKAGVSTV